MYIYAGIAAVVAVVAGILIAALTKKTDGVVYGELDKVGQITNIILIPVYAVLTLFFIALSLFLYPGYDGFGVLRQFAEFSELTYFSKRNRVVIPCF